MAEDQPVKGQAEVEESWAQRALRLDTEETAPVVVAKVMGAPAGRTIIRSTGARTGRKAETYPGGQWVAVEKLSDSTGSLTPTMRVNAGGAAAGQSLKTYVGTQSVAAAITLTLETVTAGKTFYITDIYVGSNTATVFQVTVSAGPTAIFQGFCKGDTGPISLMGIETQPSASTGTVVTVAFTLAASTTAAFMISGYEQ